MFLHCIFINPPMAIYNGYQRSTLHNSCNTKQNCVRSLDQLYWVELQTKHSEWKMVPCTCTCMVALSNALNNNGKTSVRISLCGVFSNITWKSSKMVTVAWIDFGDTNTPLFDYNGTNRAWQREIFVNEKYIWTKIIEHYESLHKSPAHVVNRVVRITWMSATASLHIRVWLQALLVQWLALGRQLAPR